MKKGVISENKGKVPTEMELYWNNNKVLFEVLTLGWNLEKIHVTWAYLENKRTRLRLYTKSFEETVHTERGDDVAASDGVRILKLGDGVMDLTTVSRRCRLKVALEDSTWR
ncbi:hypothetical protein Tco_0590510 [Tanacetum coccineum]